MPSGGGASEEAAQALIAEAEGREAARVRAKEKEKARKGRAKERKAKEALQALQALLSDTDASAEALEAAAADVERTRRGGGEAPEAVAEALRLAAQLKATSLEQLEEELAEPEASSEEEEEEPAEEEEQREEEEADAHGGEEAGAAGESLAATCCVCWEQAATHLFAPCGHQCVCVRCGEHVMGERGSRCCVVCRASVSMLIQVFVG